MNPVNYVNPSSIHIGDIIIIKGNVCKVIKITTSETIGNCIHYKLTGLSITNSIEYKEKFRSDSTVSLPIITTETYILSNIEIDSHCGCGCFAGYNCSIMINDKLVIIKLKDQNLGDKLYYAFKQGNTVNVKVNKALNERQIIDMVI